MNRVRNLIFDLDGTLIDSSEGVVAAVNYSLQRMGQPTQPAETIKKYIGYPMERMYADFTDAPADELQAHFQEKAAQTIVVSTVVLPGVSEVLQLLADRGYRMAVASTKVRRHVDGILAKFSWSPIFEVTLGSDDVAVPKPAPDIFRLVLTRLRAKPSQTVVIGDTVNDVLAARAVPMTVVAVSSPFGDERDLRASGPDFFIRSIKDLPHLLATIE